VVIAIRSARPGDNLLKRGSADLFYTLFRFVSDTDLPVGSGDFRLMDRRVVDAFLKLDERTRFNKGLFAWLGFRQEFVPYTRHSAVRKNSRWSPTRLVRLAVDGLLSFSTLPIRIWTLVGGSIAAFAFLYGLFLITRTLMFGADLPGYPSIMVAILFLGGINLFTLGLMGEYVGRILIETKRRPLYIVRSSLKAVPRLPRSKRVQVKGDG
jgi:glycosyltransferase involved in cell wall biosynthesis